MLPLQVIEEGLTFTEAVTPYLPFLGMVVGVLVTGWFAHFNRKRGAIETRAPDVNELWQQQVVDNKALDLERKLRRWLEDRLYNVLQAFRGYVLRVQGGGSSELTDHETQMFATEILDEDTITDRNKK